MSKTIRGEASAKRANSNRLFGHASAPVNNNQDWDITASTADRISGDPTLLAGEAKLNAGLKNLVHALARKAARHYIASHPAKHPDIIASEVGSRNHALARRK